MMKLAVIGKDVSGSVSPEIHNFIAAASGREISYDKISVPESEFSKRIDGILAEYDGLNVTIPYKLEIIPRLKGIAGDAKVFGAVNTVTTRDLLGYNTDGLGFMMMLENNGVSVRKKRALVLGAGGAGRSVCKKLLDAGAEVFVHDRLRESMLSVAEKFGGVTPVEELTGEEYYMIVNATGVGMHKTVGISPVPRELTERCEVAVDLIYNPVKSAFLGEAEKLGKKIINGEGMLFYQAYFSQCIYFGLEPDNALAKKMFEEFRRLKK